MIHMDVETLIKYNHPMHDGCWLTGVVPTHFVHKRVRTNNLSSQPVDNDSSPWMHAGRIAYLVVNGWDDPISIDVGVPCLGFKPDWFVYDGNHRLAAAWFRHDKDILANMHGDMEYFEDLFNNCYTIRN